MDEGRSIPLIRLAGNLIVSVQIELSDAIFERLISDVTRKIEETTIKGLILDFSGTDVIDSHITRRLRDLAVTARFMGVHTVICGLRRAVVITLVEMGLSLSGVATALNLERALEVLEQKSQMSQLSRVASPRAGSAAEEAPAATNRGTLDGADE